MRKTKTEMARVVVKELMNLSDLPRADHPEVRRIARHTLTSVEQHYEIAVRIIANRAINEAEARKAWYAYCDTHELPPDIPRDPDVVYKDRGWKGWRHWLGTTDVGQAPQRSAS